MQDKHNFPNQMNRTEIKQNTNLTLLNSDILQVTVEGDSIEVKSDELDIICILGPQAIQHGHAGEKVWMVTLGVQNGVIQKYIVNDRAVGVEVLLRFLVSLALERH